MVKSKKNAVVVKKDVLVIKNLTPMEIIQQAVAKGEDLEQVEKAMDIHFKWEANEAKKAFHKAMSEFKSNPIKIGKDKLVKYKDVRYSHASLANIVDVITKELSKHELSAAWKTTQDDKIKVTCVITHSMGHSEETSLFADPDDTGSKNSIQAIGSTISYLQRYTLLAILGLATHDQDGGESGPAPDDELIDKGKLKILRDLLVETKADEATFLSYLEIEKLEDLPKSGFAKAKIALIAKKGKK